MGNSYEMAGKDKGELLFTYKGMIETPAADNGRVIYAGIEGEKMLNVEQEGIKLAPKTDRKYVNDTTTGVKL
jgi:hypothetical protein